MLSHPLGVHWNSISAHNIKNCNYLINLKRNFVLWLNNLIIYKTAVLLCVSLFHNGDRYRKVRNPVFLVTSLCKAHFCFLTQFFTSPDDFFIQFILLWNKTLHYFAAKMIKHDLCHQEYFMKDNYRVKRVNEC